MKLSKICTGADFLGNVLMMLIIGLPLLVLWVIGRVVECLFGQPNE